jgi:thiol-disulfide isomerase/thioredoxin
MQRVGRRSKEKVMRIPHRFAIGAILLLAAGLGFGAGCAKKSDRQAAPDFTLKDIEGNDVSLSQFRGKVVILDFWATWCPPCKMEIPHFIDLQRQYGSKGLQVVGVSLDQNAPAVVPPFVQQSGINYTMLIGDVNVAEQFGATQGIPTTLVLDKHGRIAGSFLGYNDKSVFEDLTRKLLAES